MEYHSPPLSTGRFLTFLFLVSLLGAGLRLYDLTSHSVWIDELFSVRDSISLRTTFEKSWPKAFGYVSTHVGMRLAGARLDEASPDNAAQWRALGIDHFAMRIGPCVVGIVSIPILGLVSRRMLGDRAALLAALLLAVSPWHVYWSQGARFYVPQFLFYSLAVVLFHNATAEKLRPTQLILAMLFAALAFFSQLTALVIFGLFALDWLLDRFNARPYRLGLTGSLIILAAAALCVGALAWDVQHRTDQWSESFEGTRLNISTFALGVIFFIGPAVVAMGLISAWCRGRQHRRLVTYLLLGMILPGLVFALLSIRQYAGTRYAFPCLFPALALAALGLDQFGHVLREKLGRLAAWAPLVLVLAPGTLVLFSYYTDGRAFRPRWREAFAYVAEHRQPGENVLSTATLVGQYYLEEPTVTPSLARPRGLTTLTKPTWLVVAAGLPMTGLTGHWLDDHADLRSYYDVWNVRPLLSIRVYRHDPADPIKHEHEDIHGP